MFSRHFFNIGRFCCKQCIPVVGSFTEMQERKIYKFEIVKAIDEQLNLTLFSSVLRLVILVNRKMFHGT